jgi:hypothetical protein
MPLFEEVPMFFEYLAKSVPVNFSDLLPLFSVHLPFYHDQVDFIEKNANSYTIKLRASPFPYGFSRNREGRLMPIGGGRNTGYSHCCVLL